MSYNSKYVVKYVKTHYDRIRAELRKEDVDYYLAVAQIANKSLKQFTVEALEEKIERDHLR